jgi:hypothetical protein
MRTNFAHLHQHDEQLVRLGMLAERYFTDDPNTALLGITAAMLTQDHPSVQRNPLIAEVFYRTGLIEKWGRGTNRVAEMCETAGIARPEFAEIGGAAVVTFRVRVGETRLTPQVTLQVTPQVEALLRLLAAEGPLSNAAIRAGLELRDRVHVQESYIAPALEDGLVEMIGAWQAAEPSTAVPARGEGASPSRGGFVEAKRLGPAEGGTPHGRIRCSHTPRRASGGTWRADRLRDLRRVEMGRRVPRGGTTGRTPRP